MKKLYQKARSNRRQRRDYDREVHPGSEGDDAGYDPVDRQPLPDEEAAYADELKDLFGSLDDEEKRVVELKLEGCTNEEAAERMGSSERTVRRIVKRIQNMLERRFDGIANS
jgi:RNA polymerase sigma factor (sigma-70 family)